MIKKKVITWKDADQIFMTLAFSMLSTASKYLRTASTDTRGEWPLDSDPWSVENGFVADNNIQSWWSIPSYYVHQIGSGGLSAAQVESDFVSSVCWHSFQNIIRKHVQIARKSIMDARWMRKKSPKSSKQDSRNENGRSRKSKYGRKPGED